jgi:hypothetical protein
MTTSKPLILQSTARAVYYSLRCYPSAGFPKFIDSFKTLELARQWARQALKDGYHTVEILHDLPNKVGYFGIEREILETLH